MIATAEAYLRKVQGTVGFLLTQTEGGGVDGGMNGGQEKECGLCGGRERQTTRAGQEIEWSLQVCVPWTRKATVLQKEGGDRLLQ